MNQMVKRMVDLLFEDVESSEETRELYDEIMNNCQEHFRDLTDSGMTEDEALSAVMDSLSGMQDVLDQYPRKKAEQESVPEVSSAAGPDASKAEAPFRQSSSWVERLRVDAAARDVTVEPADGDEILIDCEDRENVLVERDGNALFIHVRRIADELREEAEQFEDCGRLTSEISLGDLLNRVGSYVNRAVRSVVSRVSSEIASGAPIHISVPRRKLSAVEINSSSGDLEVGGVCAAEYVLRSASGDISLKPDAKEAADRIFASTASGDVEVRDAWARTGEFSSISGDVELSGDFGDLACKSVSGEVDFCGTAVDLRSKSVSGAVDLCMKVAASGSIMAESTSGSVTVQLPDDAAPVHLAMSSVSGSLRSSVEDAGESAPLKIRLKTVSGAVKVV